MRMMRVPEAVKKLRGKITENQLRYLIRTGYVRSARVGGVLVVDYDDLVEKMKSYEPHASYPDGTVTQAELRMQTGMSRRQIELCVYAGEIIPVCRNGRKYYDLKQVQEMIQNKLGEDGDDHGGKVPTK